MTLTQTIAAIRPLEMSLNTAARNRIDNKTKPQGSLGRLEDVAVRMSLIQKNLKPAIKNKSLVVFAADHGVAMEGVSAFPAEVTNQMVLNFLAGGAAINVLCRQQDIKLRVADMGVNADFAPHPLLIDAKVRKGSRNFLKEPALTREELTKALENGIKVWENQVATDKPDIVAVGEMGIGNTSSASAIIACATGNAPEAVTGRGTGIDDAHLQHKIDVIREALLLHRPNPVNGMDILSAVGGLEIAGMTGFMLAAAATGTPVVLDGLIATAAGLAAALIQPAIKDYLFSGHRSVEKGQIAALEYLGLIPLVDLGFRLGEGTGAALAIHIIDAACRIMSEMASFEDAGVSNRE